MLALLLAGCGSLLGLESEYSVDPSLGSGGVAGSRGGKGGDAGSAGSTQAGAGGEAQAAGGQGGAGQGGSGSGGEAAQGGAPACSPSTCVPPSSCWSAECMGGKCVKTKLVDQPIASQTPNDCRITVCSDDGTKDVADASDKPPSDGNPCTLDECNGSTPAYVLQAPGADCGGGKKCDASGSCGACTAGAKLCVGSERKVCQGGSLVADAECAGKKCVTENGVASCHECLAATDCPSTPCTLAGCDPSAHTCSQTPKTKGELCEGTGTCDGKGTCVPRCTPGAVCKNPSTLEVCEADGSVSQQTCSCQNGACVTEQGGAGGEGQAGGSGSSGSSGAGGTTSGSGNGGSGGTSSGSGGAAGSASDPCANKTPAVFTPPFAATTINAGASATFVASASPQQTECFELRYSVKLSPFDPRPFCGKKVGIGNVTTSPDMGGPTQLTIPISLKIAKDDGSLVDCSTVEQLTSAKVFLEAAGQGTETANLDLNGTLDVTVSYDHGTVTLTASGATYNNSNQPVTVSFTKPASSAAPRTSLSATLGKGSTNGAIAGAVYTSLDLQWGLEPK